MQMNALSVQFILEHLLRVCPQLLLQLFALNLGHRVQLVGDRDKELASDVLVLDFRAGGAIQLGQGPICNRDGAGTGELLHNFSADRWHHVVGVGVAHVGFDHAWMHNVDKGLLVLQSRR